MPVSGGGAAVISGDVSVQPFSEMVEGGLTELIGVDEQVSQNQYSGSVEVTLSEQLSGEILGATLYSNGGSIIVESGELFFFDLDPSIAVGAAAIGVAEWPTSLGSIPVLSSDWTSDSNGAHANIKKEPITIHPVSSLFLVYKHTGSTQWNSLVGDNELLRVNFWIRRDS